MKSEIRKAVRQRAANCCEYCGLRKDDLPVGKLQVEHVIARQHDGTDDLSNLALACPWCNLHKGPNLSGIDPITRNLVQLFHPRQQTWSDHFDLIGDAIVGLTPTGRATVQVLDRNANEPLQNRADKREGRE